MELKLHDGKLDANRNDLSISKAKSIGALETMFKTFFLRRTGLSEWTRREI